MLYAMIAKVKPGTMEQRLATRPVHLEHRLGRKHVVPANPNLREIGNHQHRVFQPPRNVVRIPVHREISPCRSANEANAADDGHAVVEHVHATSPRGAGFGRLGHDASVDRHGTHAGVDTPPIELMVARDEHHRKAIPLDDLARGDFEVHGVTEVPSTNDRVNAGGCGLRQLPFLSLEMKVGPRP